MRYTNFIDYKLTVRHCVFTPKMMNRLEREQKTIEAMIRLYCRQRHLTHSEQLCPECSELLDYAHQRLQHCPFQLDKPTCAHCPIHCYRSEKQQQIRIIMRSSGPQMLWHHPWLALMHFWDGRKRKPGIRKAK